MQKVHVIIMELMSIARVGGSLEYLGGEAPPLPAHYKCCICFTAIATFHRLGMYMPYPFRSTCCFICYNISNLSIHLLSLAITFT